MPARTLVAILFLASCAGAPSRPRAPAPAAAAPGPTQRAAAFLDFYNATLLALAPETNEAQWAASTDVNDRNVGRRLGADAVSGAFEGSAYVIRTARGLLEHRDDLDALTIRQLEKVLYEAADSPMLEPALARRRVAAEARQSELLDGYQFCLERRGDACLRPVTANEIVDSLVSSRDLAERLRVWRASKEIGTVLRPGIVELRDLRNGVARQMGHGSFWELKVSDYGMTSAEMVQLLERLVAETRPLFEQLHCFARHELARRYGVSDVPALLPAHWLGNRWGQDWPGLVEAVDVDALVAGRDPRWLVQQGERFYVSMGMPSLPASFWERSDLYPVPTGQTRRKNSHASAWHLDLEGDVRSLMSVEPDWDWFYTVHHELGHIYYFLAYSRPEVPPLLREGANRSFHEALGDLIGLSASQTPYLREIGILPAGQSIDQTKWLLNEAFTGPIVFLTFAAGTMSHFEQALYEGNLDAGLLNQKWWELVRRFQGIVPPEDRGETGCDACTKTHINDDPAQYYDYALANVLVYQLHEHICREIVHADPHECTYWGRRDVGELLRGMMQLGQTRDWREVLVETTGHELTAEPMLRYFQPVMAYLQDANRGRTCELPEP
ncbi:MAG: M2 family metallopeptidase [Deltaproteobacteria bacterium]|nr:M2 family metallopeptidase [Deltaproteobacteria bacterium]